MLNRPLDQRIREHKYRCAQSLVFGLPVIGLQYFGYQLGGPESARWVTVMQIVLTGWILFVAGTGMLSEGIVLLVARRRVTADFIVALIALALFVFSCISAAVFFLGTNSPPRFFHVVVIILAAWSGVRWISAGKSTTPQSGSAAKSEA